MPCTPLLDHKVYSHVFHSILSFADDEVLRVVRTTSKHAANRADRVLYSHVIVEVLPARLKDPFHDTATMEWHPLTKWDIDHTTPALILRSPSGTPLPADPAWLVLHREDGNEDLSQLPRMLELFTHILTCDYMSPDRGPFRISRVATTLALSNFGFRSKSAVLRIAVRGKGRLRPQKDTFLIRAPTVVHFTSMAHFEPLSEVRLEAAIWIPVIGTHHLYHIAYDPNDPNLATASIDLLSCGGDHAGVRPGPVPPVETVVFLFQALDVCDDEAADPETHESSQADPDPLGPLASCLPTMVAHPTAVFTFVGVESLLASAIPALSIADADPTSDVPSNIEPRSWCQRMSALSELIVEAVATHPPADLPRELRPPDVPSPAELSLSFLTLDEYRTKVGSTHFALATVPPRLPISSAELAMGIPRLPV